MWIEPHREWLKSLCLRALDALREDAERRWAHVDVFRWSRRILDLDLYQEGAYRSLMVAHARLGEPTQVRSWYALCRRRLLTELDVEPSRATTRVYRQAMSGTLVAGIDARHLLSPPPHHVHSPAAA